MIFFKLITDKLNFFSTYRYNFCVLYATINYVDAVPHLGNMLDCCFSISLSTQCHQFENAQVYSHHDSNCSPCFSCHPHYISASNGRISSILFTTTFLQWNEFQYHLLDSSFTIHDHLGSVNVCIDSDLLDNFKGIYKTIIGFLAASFVL